MKKYKFVVKKIQYAYHEVEWNEDETIGDVTERLEKLSEEELGFSDPEYHLEAISKTDGKTSKILWRTFF